MPRLLQIELNEFDPGFLRAQAEKLDLSNIKTFLSWSHSETWTDDETEHQGLDPWVQWVNVHSGLPSNEHGIKRLGDTQRQSSPQIWEQVAQLGFSWGAWGVMNAPSGDLAKCDVFMPDPWSFEESPHPKQLENLLALPRYMARNYLDPSKLKFILNGLRLARYFAPPSHWSTLLKFTNQLLRNVRSPGINLHSLTTLLDYLGTLEFIKYRQHDTAYNVIFLNHIAHLQHQFWLAGDELHDEMKLGLQVCDLTIGLLLDSIEDKDAVIVMNGLKQKNVAGQGFYVYRQINPEMVTSKLLPGVAFSIEQCMTHDAHIHFTSEQDTSLALNRLQSAVLGDSSPLLYCERLGANHIFIQLDVERKVERHEQITMKGYDAPTICFYDLFELVCERTGAHIQTGDIFSKGLAIPERLNNHEIGSFILDYFSENSRSGLDDKRTLSAA